MNTIAERLPVALGSWWRWLAHGLCALLCRLPTAYLDYRLRRATALLLYGLDDRSLKDIGLARSEIGSIVIDCGVAGSPSVRTHYPSPAD